MLTLVEIHLLFPEDVKVHPAMGSVLHGVLMECITPDVAACFHEMALRPYSQCVYWDVERHEAIWRIGTISSYAYEHLVQPVQTLKKMYLKHKGYIVQLRSVEIVQQTTYKKLADFYMQGQAEPSGADWNMMTVTSFKQGGRYVITPDMRLVYQSLLNKWNTFSTHSILDETGIIEQMANHCRLAKYQLSSRTFPLEGQYVCGFSGTMRQVYFGFDMLKRLQGLLTAYATFAGIGVKTALGMGAVDTKVLFTGRKQE